MSATVRTEKSKSKSPAIPPQPPRVLLVEDEPTLVEIVDDILRREVGCQVIPAANLPAYTGDWIVWFAEPGKAPGDSPRMRAPIPLQKTEPAVAGLASAPSRSETRIQLAAVIKSNGHVDGVTLVRGPGTAASQSAMEDLKRWEFRPAMRDGAPIDVEVVIEIPFSLAWLSL